MKIVVVGAGLAGLCCARTLHRAGIPFQILEASDGVGYRVCTLGRSVAHPRWGWPRGTLWTVAKASPMAHHYRAVLARGP